MKIGDYLVIETITRFLPYSINWLYELYSKFFDQPVFFAEYRNNSEQFIYKNLIYISKNNKDIRIITEIKYYLKFHILYGNKKIILHSHFGPKGYYDYIFFKKWNKKAKQIVSFYGYDISTLLRRDKWKNRYKKLGEKVDLFLVLGNNMKSRLMEIGINEKKIKIFHLGVDLNKMCYNKKYLIKNKVIKFIAVGRFAKKKAIPLIVKSFKKYLNIYKNANLVIIGDSDGSVEQEYEKKRILEEIKGEYQEKIKLLGVQNYYNMLKYINDSDILLHPSITSDNGDSEGTPLVIINSMALGVPTIATNHSDIKEIIINNKNGYLVNENDVDGLVNAMISLSNNPEIYAFFSREARKHIEENFNLEIQVKELQKFYIDIIE
jgi:colanic acid/amylovoran biosynthesis glycosyltransferase